MLARIVFLLTVLLSLNTSAREYASTGFYYPMKNESPNFSTCGRWLERYPPNGCYSFQDSSGNNLYHTGSDMMASVGTPVYAIADGEVKIRSTNGWGSGNIALIIEHKKYNGSNPKTFRAIYGHIASSKNVGDSVRAGDQIGTIGPWSSGSHLHFGILSPGLNVPVDGNYMGRWKDNKYGIQESGYYDNGLIDSIWFITHNAPDNWISRGLVNQGSLSTIPPTNPWFPQLCGATSPPDARCSGEDVVAYTECLYENSNLCTPSVKTYSSIKGGGSGSGAGAGGGGSYNLNQDTDILDPASGNEWQAGVHMLRAGQVVNIRARLESEGGDVRDFIQPGKDKIESRHSSELAPGSTGPASAGLLDWRHE